MEMWKTIMESDNYQISNFGQFKNKKTNKVLKCNINKNGYLYCNISIKSKVKKVKIHRLVAKAFVENINNSETVNHLDANKINNHYLNLEWLTLKENISHAHKMGLYKKKQSINCN